MTIYTCWIPDYGHTSEDGKRVTAFDAAGAAARYMEHYEQRNSEYPVASGGSEDVAVSTDGGDPVIYTVWGEARASYYARQAKEQS